MNNFKIKFSKKSLFLTFIILCFLPPAYLSQYTLVTYAYRVLRFFIALYIIPKWCSEKYDKSLIDICLLFIIYSIFILSTYFYGTSSMIKSLIYVLIYGGTFCILIDYYMFKDYKTLVHSFRQAFEIMIAINFISIFIFPNGLYQVTSEFNDTINPAYFLGHRNNSIEFMIPLLGSCLLESYIGNKRITLHFYFILIICLISVIKTWSVNALLALLIFVLYSIFCFKNRKRKFINGRSFALTSAIISWLLIVTKIEEKFQYFIEHILHKSMTLTGRVGIWEKSLQYIKQSIWTGYGVESNLVKYSKIGALNSCHNYFLDFVYYGGIFMLLIVILLFIRLTRKTASKDLESIILYEISSITIGAYSILWIATPIHRSTLCFMFGYLFIMNGLRKYKKRSDDKWLIDY